MSAEKQYIDVSDILQWEPDGGLHISAAAIQAAKKPPVSAGEPAQEWLNYKEVREYLRIGVRTLQRLLEQKVLKSETRPGNKKKKYILKSDLDRYLEQKIDD